MEKDPVNKFDESEKSFLPCSICNNFGHKEEFCSVYQKEIKILVPGGADSVEFFSSINDWKQGTPMSQYQGDLWKKKVQFQIGRHSFKFLVNKRDWRTSSYYQVSTNKFHTQDNFLFIKPKNNEDYHIQFKGSHKRLKLTLLLTEWSIKQMIKSPAIPHGALEDLRVEVFGNFNGWSKGVRLRVGNRGGHTRVWRTEIRLEGLKVFIYKFRINGRWVVDPYRKLYKNDDFQNHYIKISPQQTESLKNDPLQQIQFGKGCEVRAEQVRLKESPHIFNLWGHSLNVINNKVYIIGGVGKESYTNFIYEIDLETWRVRIKEMDDKNGPDMLAFHKTVTFNDKVIVYGGQNEQSVSSQYHTFNAKTSRWTCFKLKDRITREHFSATLMKESPRVYFFGGYFFDEDSLRDINYNDLCVLNLKHMAFEKLSTRNNPRERCQHTAAIVEWKFYLFGGCSITDNSREIFDDLFELDLSEEELAWGEIKVEGRRPIGRYGHLCLVSGFKMIIHGGKTYDYQKLGEGDLIKEEKSSESYETLLKRVRGRKEQYGLEYKERFDFGEKKNN